MDATTSRIPTPIMWVMIGIPVAAVLASFITLGLAIRGAEPELPASYHWEGQALDEDLARLQNASAISLGASLRFAADGSVAVTLRDASTSAPLPQPQSLTLRLAHATLAGRDRVVTLQRDGDVWRASTAPLPRGHWLVELADNRSWLLRGELSAPVDQAELRANTPGAPAP